MNFPIEHLSYSSVRTYCSDRAMFYKTYIKKEYSDLKNAAMLEGTVVHHAIDRILKEQPEQDIDTMIDDCTYRGSSTDYGKNGSPEKSRRTMEQTIEFFIKDRPDVGDVQDSEVTLNSLVTDPDGFTLPIPMKGKLDAITIKDGQMEIIDWKTVAGFSSPDKDPLIYRIQSIMYFLLCKAVYGEYPARMHFYEIKKTKNRTQCQSCEKVLNKSKKKDKEYVDCCDEQKPYIPSQVRPITIELPDDKIIMAFCTMIRRICKEITGESLYDPDTGDFQAIPNPFDMLSGAASWKEFLTTIDND